MGDALIGKGKAIIQQPDSIALSQYTGSDSATLDSVRHFNDCIFPSGFCRENQTGATYSTFDSTYYLLIEEHEITSIPNSDGDTTVNDTNLILPVFHRLYLFSSKDGVNFTDSTLIYFGRDSDNLYPSIVPSNWTQGSDDFNRVDGEFNVIYFIGSDPGYYHGVIPGYYWRKVTL